MRGKDYTVLDQESVQSRLHLPADQQFSHWESGLVRQLYDCHDVAVGPEGCRCRIVVATHPEASKKSRIGHTRKGVVYALFFTQLPQDAFTASDVVALYLHRGAGPRPLVLSLARWTRSLADCLAMGLEPAPGTGPSA